MSKPIYYYQCKLQKETITTVCWIPEKFAIVEKSIKIKHDDKTWDDGWVVKEIWGKVDEDHLPDSHKEIKAHKKRTGDSMPKE